VPRLLAIVRDAEDDANVRWRIVWALRAHNVNLSKIEGVYPALAEVLRQPKSSENRMLRYDCAYMLGVLQRDEVPNEVLDTLLDFLKDANVQIYTGTQASVQGSDEKVAGKATVKEVGQGDGRLMATQALTRIGPDRLRKRPDIIQQLRTLANDAELSMELRKQCQELLRQ
jgi:hypothetical protein